VATDHRFSGDKKTEEIVEDTKDDKTKSEPVLTAELKVLETLLKGIGSPSNSECTGYYLVLVII